MCADTCESVIRLDNGLMVALSLVDGLGTLCGAGQLLEMSGRMDFVVEK